MNTLFIDTLLSAKIMGLFTGYTLVYLLLFYYLFVFAMGIYRAWLAKRLTKWQIVLFSPPLVVLGVGDVLFNYTLGVVFFLSWPPARNWTLSDRLQTYHHQVNANWRQAIATFVCTRMLDPFDPTGDHC
jgi:hypothetical protein